MLALTLVPLFLLGGMEGVLRLVGYGYPTGFFRPMRIGAEDFLVENDQVGLRFFPPELLRLPPPVRMRAHKAPDTYRIFIFGESAAMGDPEPAFGAGRYLEALLRERYPLQNFEVVNVSMTAINSHAILPIARDCARQQGDLWLIYMGNNEMVGPFGAATVFGAQAPPLTVIRLGLALQETRVGQLLALLGRKLNVKSEHRRAWGGMRMFTEDRVSPRDPRREKVYGNFQANLHDILKVGLDSGASVLLSTVAVNLKDCPPFASVINTNLPSAERARLNTLTADAANLVGQGRTAEAAAACEQAARIAPEAADVQFEWAECLSRQGDSGGARSHFELASGLDALPFRTDSRLNGLIADEASRFAGRPLILCDAARVLATNSPAEVPGQESFYEHVHLNFDGNYRLARAWAEGIQRLLPSGVSAHAAGPWASQQVCEQRLGLTDWNRCNVIEEVIRRMQQPPLSSQANNPARVQALTAWETGLHQRMDAAAAARAREEYLDALRRAPEDFHLHENFADFLQATGNYAEAAVQWQQVRVLLPQDHVALYELGRLAGLQNQWAEAEAWLGRSLELRPNFANAWAELGKAHAAQEKFDTALSDYRRALEFQPGDYATWYYAGLALSKLQRRAEAIEHYRQATRLNPGFWEAHFELGGQLGLEGRLDDARAELEQAIRLKPDFAMAHLNLGIALMKQGHLDEAQREFEETLRAEPGNKLASTCLAQLRTLRKTSR